MIQYKGYVGSAEFDADAEIFHGEVLGIRDVVTFEGHSVRELTRAFRDSVDDYLQFCAERGEKPDKAYSGKFVVRIGPDLHRRMSVVARTSKMSINTLVANCLEAAVAPSAPSVGSGGSVGTKRRKGRTRKRAVTR